MQTAGQRSEPCEFVLRPEGVQVWGTATGQQPNVVWLEFQRRAPVFTTATYVWGVLYAAGDVVYYTDGNCYAATAAIGELDGGPGGESTSWAVAPFPYYLAEYATMSVYASLTNREQQQPENLSVQLAAGWPLLAAEVERVERMQGQTRQLRVKTR
jgi:hypothetical protein